MAAPLKDIRTMLELGPPPPAAPIRILSEAENAQVTQLVNELFETEPDEEGSSDADQT